MSKLLRFNYCNIFLKGELRGARKIASLKII